MAIKVNNYSINKIIDSIYNKGYSNFVNQIDLKSIKNKLYKNEYNIYEVFTDCNKVILYQKELPELILYKVETKNQLRHQDVLGSLYSLGIDDDLFSDVIHYHGEFYFYSMKSISQYIKYNLTTIGNNPVNIVESDLNIKELFHQEYIEKTINVSSLRIDNVVSTLSNTSRSDVIDKFKNNEVTLNYDSNIKATRALKEGDIFSIKRIGKFKFDSIINTTRKGFYIIKLLIYK